MAKYLNPGESIECSHSNIAVRKVSDNPTYLNVACLNGQYKKLFKYKTKIRAIVAVAEELNPRESLICDTSHLNIDDVLEADVVEIFTEKRVKLEVTSNFSHVHGIQSNYLSAFTYAKIIVPWRFVFEKKAIEQ